MRLRQKGKEKLAGCRVRGTYSCVAGIGAVLRAAQAVVWAAEPSYMQPCGRFLGLPTRSFLQLVAQAEAYTTEKRECGLVDAGCSFPIDNVNQLPRVPNEIPLQLPLLIDHELGFRVQQARALGLIRVIQVEFSSR